MSDHAIPVTIVTGFLGAGKSTLLQTWLRELPREGTAVIINERGDVGIDGELLASRVARLREITGGCVCCSSQAELVDALSQLAASSPRPNRIVVETSGAASPAGVIRAIGRGPANEREFRLDGVITVADVTRTSEVLEFDLAAEQLGFADIVVLSHVDSVTTEGDSIDIGTVEHTVRQYAPAALVVRSRNGTTGFSFLELLERRAEALYMPDQGSAHPIIEAVSFIANGELDDERFADWVESALARVESRILRIKGIVAMHGVDHRVIIQGVGHAVEVQLGAPWKDTPRTSRLVILGLELNAESLEAGFNECAMRPESVST